MHLRCENFLGYSNDELKILRNLIGVQGGICVLKLPFVKQLKFENDIRGSVIRMG